MRSLRRRCAKLILGIRGVFFAVVVFFVFLLHMTTRQDQTPHTQVFAENGEQYHSPHIITSIKKGGNHSLPPSTHLLPSPHKLVPPSPSLENDWQEAKGSNRDFFLYSAYLDRRGTKSQVIIISIIKKKKKVNSCNVWTGNQTMEVKAKTKLIHENWNLPYSAGFILCPIPKDTHPSHVTLTNYPSPVLTVQDMSARGQEGRLSVCVKPFHYDYDRAVWLVEFIEFYRLLGADKFIFYNHTMGPKIEEVVRYYVKEGVVSLLPWTLPVVTQKEIRTEGIFAALNDCNLRSVRRFELAAMVDLDEFLLPKRHDSLLSLIDEYTPQFGAYVFQNAFFYLYWENDTKAFYNKLHEEGVDVGEEGAEGRVEPYLLTGFKTRRLNTLHNHGVRSKYIVRPERVMEVGNHGVWEFIGNKSNKKVSNTDGLSHHYRICEYGGFECIKKASQVDRTAHTWLSRVYTQVMAKCRKIFPAEGTCPPAPPLGSPW